MPMNQGFKGAFGEAPYIYQETTSGTSVAIGMDATNSNAFVIQTDTVPGAIPVGGNISIDPSTGQLTIKTGTLTLSQLASFPGIAQVDNTGLFSTITPEGTDGQLLIGATSGPPIWASLTAGANITITPGANSITIAASGGGGGGITTLDGDSGSATGSTVTLAGTSNLVSTSATGSTVTFTLPDIVIDPVLNNIAIDDQAPIPSVTGNKNVSMGHLALNAITSSPGNVAIGYRTLQSQTDGGGNGFNVAIGTDALRLCDVGYDNLSIGGESGRNIAGGFLNTGFGAYALNALTTGAGNIALGSVRNGGGGTSGVGGSYSSSESDNILIGSVGVTGDNNICRIGDASGTGPGQIVNTFIQGIAGITVSNTNFVTIDTTTGQLGSTASGGGGITTLDGDSGSATGSTVTIAGTANLISTSATGSTVTLTLPDVVIDATNHNIAIDDQAPIPSASGASANVSMGHLALNAITSSINNTAIGYRALNAQTTGGGNGSNVAVGHSSLQACTVGYNNASVGAESLRTLTTGFVNTAIGLGSGNALTTGAGNTLIGQVRNGGGGASGSGSNYTSSESDNILINSVGTLADANICRIGNSTGSGPGQIVNTFIQGIAGVTVSNQQFVQIDTTTGQLGSVSVSPSGITEIDGDTGSTTGPIVKIAGGTGITTAVSGTTVTITSTGGGSGIGTLDGDTGSATGTTITLAGGSGMSTVASGSTVTFNAKGGGYGWIDQTSSIVMANNIAYVADSSSLVTLTLPTTVPFGTTFKITGKGTGGWQMAQQSGQTTHFLSATTTTGTGGSLASTGQYDTIEILCITANTTFSVIQSNGNITVV